jgi:predicted RNA binding protein YcfA (HicA-like mRNA interferase family)
MPKLPGVNHLRAIKALEKAGFHIDRQGKHVFVSKGSLQVVVPRNNPIDPYTMAATCATPVWPLNNSKSCSDMEADDCDFRLVDGADRPPHY